MRRMLDFLTDAERLEFSEVSSESRQWSVGIRRFTLICKRLFLNADKLMFKQSCLLNIIGQFPKHRDHRNSKVLKWRITRVQFYSRLQIYKFLHLKALLGKLLLKHIFSFAYEADLYDY